jgi:putative membrane protein
MHVPIASILHFFEPYEFSPTVALIALLSLAAYVRGLRLRGLKGQGLRAFAFVTGVAIMYVSLQTQYDYWAQHMFFMHRTQHLILHHLGPVLIVLSAPFATMRAGMPEPVRRRVVDPILANSVLRACYRAVQQPVVAGVIFVGLIYFWLIPPIHFYAMLNVPLYNTMNWGMAVDGLLFWRVMLDPRVPSPDGAAGYGVRIGVLIAVAFPQILLGALISFAQHDLYPNYAICGRMWPISPVVDQQLGGLITWIPPAMMSFIGLLIVLSQWMRNANPEGIPAAAVRQ